MKSGNMPVTSKPSISVNQMIQSGLAKNATPRISATAKPTNNGFAVTATRTKNNANGMLSHAMIRDGVIRIVGTDGGLILSISFYSFALKTKDQMFQSVCYAPPHPWITAYPV